MGTPSQRKPRQRRGMALVWVTLCMMVMLGLIGLALDTGYAVLVGNQLQNAADAAALAGARIVIDSQPNARSAASAIGGSNLVAGSAISIDSNSDVTVGRYNTSTHVFTSGGTPVNAVRVVARRATGSASGPVSLFFGSVFGVATVDMSRTAIAMAIPMDTPSLVVLDPTGSSALDVGGSGGLVLPQGGIQVNSTAGDAVRLGGSGMVDAQYLHITGGITGSSYFTGGPIVTGSPPVADPLAGLPDPTVGSTRADPNVGNGGDVTITPGHYQAITIKGNLHLTQGIYVIDSGGLNMSAHGSIDSIVGGVTQGVMLYFYNGGTMNLQGNNLSMNLVAPDPTRDTFSGADIYRDVTIFQARDNFVTNHLPISGAISLTGTVYVPSAELDITASGTQSGVKLVVYRLQLRGSGTLSVTAPNVQVNTGRPFLVE